MQRKRAERESSWPVGLGVWVAHLGQWCHGLIEERPSRAIARVRLDSGELLSVGFKGGLIRSNRPIGEEVPRSRRVNSHTGMLDVLFERKPDGSIGPRKTDVWSSKAPACVDCHRTDRPHEAFGRCRLCYIACKRKTDPVWRAHKNQLKKESAMRSDYQERRDAARRNDPKRKEQRREICRRYHQRHLAVWPIGAAVHTRLGNVNVDKDEPRLERKASNSGPWLAGTIEATNNASAFVRFAGFALWIPFRRLERFAEVQAV